MIAIICVSGFYNEIIAGYIQDRLLITAFAWTMPPWVAELVYFQTGDWVVTYSVLKIEIKNYRAERFKKKLYKEI